VAARVDRTYPDLVGKAVILAGDREVLSALAAGFAANGALPAIVSPIRAVVDDAVRRATENQVATFGVHADPALPDVWRRAGAQIEQRVGPIDIVVAAGGAAMRSATGAALLPDMGARRRGRFIVIDEVIDETVELPAPLPGVGLRAIETGSGDTQDVREDDIVTLALMCASDRLDVARLTIQLGDRC
jgi:hypothetical protein